MEVLLQYFFCTLQDPGLHILICKGNYFCSGPTHGKPGARQGCEKMFEDFWAIQRFLFGHSSAVMEGQSQLILFMCDAVFVSDIRVMLCVCCMSYVR